MLARLRMLEPAIAEAPAHRTPQEIVNFCTSNFGPDDFEGPEPEQMERLCDFLGVPYEPEEDPIAQRIARLAQLRMRDHT